MPVVAILVFFFFEQLPLLYLKHGAPLSFPDELVPVRLLTSDIGVGCPFVGLGVRCHFP